MDKEREIVIGDAIGDCPLFFTNKDVIEQLIKGGFEQDRKMWSDVERHLKKHHFNIYRGLYYLYGEQGFIQNHKQFAHNGKIITGLEE